MTERRYICGGLFTDPAPTGPVPEGAMDEAKDVTIRRANIARSRPRFGDHRTTSMGHVHSMVPYDGDILCTHQNSMCWESTHTTDITGGSAAPESNSVVGWIPTPVAEARGNLYIGGDDGPYKVTASSDAALTASGIAAPPPLWVQAQTGNTVTAADQAVSYRATVEREDANGVITVSAPTGQKIWANHSVSGKDVSVSFYVPHLTAGDTVKVFRSRAVTSSSATPGFPSDDHYLVHEHKVTSSDISAIQVTFTDDVDEADLGEPLYTNPTRERVTRANIRAPYCEAMALYKDCVFYGNTIGPQQMTLRFDGGGDQTGNATGIGYRTISGTTSIGTPTITLSDTTGLKVGMLVTNATAWTGGTPVRITAIVANTSVTVDTNADDTVAPDDITYFDTIRIGSSYYAVAQPYLEYGLVTAANDYSDAAPGLHLLSPGLDARIDYDGTTNDAMDIQGVTIVLQEDDRVGGTFDIYATHGDEYNPPLEEPTASATTTSADAWPNALFYSKTDQPEHVPLGNYVRVGSESHPIQRLIATRDALWVFKTDGIFRLTGQGEKTGWRVDPYDLSAPLIHRSYATELDGNVYAWTIKGVLMLGENGDRPISRGTIGNLLKAHEEAFKVDAGGATDFAACWSDPLNHEVYFSDLTGGYLYVFNVKTGAWVRWTNGHIDNADCGTWASGCWNPADGLSYMGMATDGGGGSGYILKEDANGESQAAIDAELEWTDHADDPGVTHRFQDVAILWEDRTSMVAYDVVFNSAADDTTDTQSYTSSGTHAVALPAYVPRDHSVSTRLGVKVSTQQQFSEGHRDWAISGLRVNSEPVTAKVSR